MKASDYIVILLLVVGLGALGFLFTQQDKSVEEIIADISGKVTGSSSDSTNFAPEPENNTNEQNPNNTYIPPVANPPTTTTPTNQNPVTSNSPGQVDNSPVQNDYNYSNSEYGFYVNLPERVVTQKTTTGLERQMVYLDKPNGERDFIVSIFTSAQWQQYWDSLSSTFNYVGDVAQNGLTFKYYTRPAVDPGINDPQTLHYYILQYNGYYYEVYTTNVSNINFFGFL